MVQIEPPVAATPSTDSAATGPTTSGNTNPVANQRLAVGSSQVDSGALTQDAIDAEADESVDPATAPSGFAADSTIPPSPDGLGGPMPPAWQSERTQRSRQIGLVAAIGGSSLLGAVLLFGWFVKNWSETDRVSTIENVVDDLESEAAAAPIVETEVVAEPDSTPQPGAEREPEKEVPVTPESPMTEPLPESSVDSELKDSASPAKEPSPTDIPKGFLDDNPLGLDEPMPKAADSDNEQESGPIDLPDAANDLLDIFNLNGGQQKLPQLDAPKTVDEVEPLDGAVRENVDPMLTFRPVERINYKQKLGIKTAFATTGNKGYPLADLMLLFSQISSVPIQIDWVSFDLCGVGIRQNVTGLKQMGFQSLEKLLDQTADSVDATITKQETMMTLSPKDELLDQKLSEILDFSDFGAGQATAITTINKFLGDDSVRSVNVGDERWDKQLAALAAETLRFARGKNRKVDNAALARWVQSAADPNLDWPVVSGGEAGPQLLEPMAMAGFLRTTSRRNQASCFVYWVDANRRGMSPQQLTMPFIKPPAAGNAKASDAGAVLGDALKPFGLHIRQVDSQHWWVGTEATYDRFPVLVWTPPLGAGQAAFNARVDQALNGIENFQRHMAVDPDTGSTIILLPRFVVRQIPKLMKVN